MSRDLHSPRRRRRTALTSDAVILAVKVVCFHSAPLSANILRLAQPKLTWEVEVGVAHCVDVRRASEEGSPRLGAAALTDLRQGKRP